MPARSEIITCSGSQCQDIAVTCTDSPCTINCAENYACVNATLICNVEECNIRCTAHHSCKHSTINCTNSSSCSVECSSTDGCRYSNIIEPTYLRCSTNYACSSSSINCSSTHYCDLRCDGWYGCSSSSIIYAQNIECLGDHSCLGSSMYWNSTDDINILCEWKGCQYSNIECSASNNCAVRCQNHRACDGAFLNGPKYVACNHTSEQYVCYNSTINCYTVTCNVLCNGWQTCRYMTFDCKNSHVCNLGCDTYHSCSDSNIIGVTHVTCSSNSQEYGCHSSNIICNENNDCNIWCGRRACASAKIYGAINYNLSVDCRMYQSCSNTMIDARYSSNLQIDGCTEDQSCQAMDIYCPPNDNGRIKCTIEGDASFNSNQFYAIYGWNDVMISSSATTYGGFMHCTMSYEQTCLISNTGWMCDVVSHICNNPPTSNPTFNPSITPTALPTFIPSSTPTSTPTKYPTSTPSAIPTFIPSKEPTNRQTCAETSDEFTGSFVISFDYSQKQNNLSNTIINDIIDNVTNIFIQETIATQTNCKMDSYGTKITVNNNHAIVDILACFECNTVLKVDTYDDVKLQKDFIETFKRETTILTVEANSTTITVIVKKPESEVVDTTQYTTTIVNALEKRSKNRNNVFLTIVIIFGIGIGLCVICLIILCVGKQSKYKHAGVTKEQQVIAMTNMSTQNVIKKPDMERIISTSINMQIGEDMNVYNNSTSVPCDTKGGDDILSDDIIIEDDMETPNDSDEFVINDDQETPDQGTSNEGFDDDDTGSIIIGDDEETKGMEHQMTGKFTL